MLTLFGSKWLVMRIKSKEGSGVLIMCGHLDLYLPRIRSQIVRRERGLRGKGGAKKKET